MIARAIDSHLQEWKESRNRRVLLIRGARQVGKTHSIRQLAKSFSSFIEVNFLETPEIKKFFQEGSISPDSILEKLQAYFGITLSSGKSLLFFDEIQECPEALMSLRFFHEKLPELHVIAAGSLLEFVMSEIPSFGVGRIDSLFMYPLSVEEFFRALGEELLLEAIIKALPEAPLDSILHTKALELYKTYLIIGGLPAVVQSYIQSRDINECLLIIGSIVQGYEDDFAKYNTRISSQKLRDTLRATAKQAGSKFVAARVDPERSSSGYDKALELLRLAGLVYKILPTNANGIPLEAESENRGFKVIPFDVGFNNALLGLNVSEFLLQDNVSLVNKGALAEIVCGTEIIKHSFVRKRSQLYYWKRNSRGSSSEVDYIVQRNSNIVPVEVKAGTKGQMQSLYLFLKNKNKSFGIRTSLENFSSFSAPDMKSQINVVPLYAIGRYLHTK